MQPISEFKDLCGDQMRASVATPFSIRHKQTWWDVATDGRGLLMLRVDSPSAEREDAPKNAAQLVMCDDKATHELDLQSWLKWCSPRETTVACEYCVGGIHSCNCKYCEMERGTECDECDAGRVHVPWPVRFAGVTMDIGIARRYLERMPGERVAVLVRKEKDPIEFRGDGWKVCVMPRLAGAEDEDMPEGLLVPA